MRAEKNMPVWQNKYEIDVPDIDFQHKHFQWLIKIFYLMVHIEMKKITANHINEIISYAKFDFCKKKK